MEIILRGTHQSAPKWRAKVGFIEISIFQEVYFCLVLLSTIMVLNFLFSGQFNSEELPSQFCFLKKFTILHALAIAPNLIIDQLKMRCIQSAEAGNKSKQGHENLV